MFIHISDCGIKTDIKDIIIKDNTITFSKTINDVIILKSDNKISNDITITIKDSFIKLINEDINSNVNINVLDNSKLIYRSIFYNSSNLTKVININESATMDYDLISLGSYNENLEINLANTYANCNIKYLIVNDNNKSNINAKINHLAKNTTSQISNYSICNSNANINFSITGFIKKDNSSSNCRQLTKGIIIGDNSTIKVIPSLLIDEYDISAYHGASIGKVNEDDLFYLMSRGLTKNEAFRLILSGIINPFINIIEIDDLRNRLVENINKLI